MLKLGFRQNEWARLPAAEKKNFFSSTPALEILPDADPELCDFLLFHEADGWKMTATGETWAPLHLDFLSPQWKQRAQDPLKWRDPLVKACGLSPKSGQTRILDLTAGLGGDSWMLHELGASILAYERSAPLYWLLSDALKRCQARDFSLRFGSFAVKNGDPYKTDIIYIDPMFPAEKKKALPPREMQYLRRLLGETSDDYFSLLELALRTPVSRIVMKSALKGPVDERRQFSVEGKSHRFDVFLRP